MSPLGYAVIGLGAAALLCAVIAVLMAIGGGNLRRRAGGWPAPGDGQPPVPGQRTADAEPPPPGRPAPAPGLPTHDHGGLDYTVRVWKCGCIHLYGGHGQLTGCTPCHPAALDDDDIREWLS